MIQRRVVYDTEMYANLLLYVFYDIDTGQWYKFEISPYRDQRKELMEFLKSVILMIGFNNLKFDYPVLHFLFQILKRNFSVSARELLRAVNIKVIEVIKSRFPEIRQPLIPQLDLYRIHHFDNMAKATSLKMLEFVLRMRDIAELPFHPNTFLSSEQRDYVVMYCRNDVHATNVVYDGSQQEIVMRQKLGEIYGLVMTNWNDAKIGESILVKFLKQALGKESLGKTPRETIVVKDILFDYLYFESPEFSAIHSWFQSRVLKGTKGVFSDLPLSEVESLIPFIYLGKDNIKKKTLVKSLNVVKNEFMYVFGLGGIHGSIQSGIYLSDQDWIIKDIDVEGFYPDLSIKNRFYPEHLSEVYCDTLLLIKNERKKYPKKTPENTGLKLAGNASYGKSNSEFSPLYDPQYTMKTTINGQLLLCMLSEWLSVIPDLIMIQANTDGFTIKIKRSFEGLFDVICKKWEDYTNLRLEHSSYSKMVIRDVNNYLAVSFDGKVKLKGAFLHEREWHKNHSQLIVPKALEQFYVYGTPIEQTIRSGDMWDFFKRVKLQSTSKLVGRMGQFETEYGKITRYYVSTVGETLLKIMPPLAGKTEDREFNIEAGFLCTTANSVTDQLLEEMKLNINYDYYIAECNKVITAINLHQHLEEDE